ncbi:MAG: efflux RND transporter periplasmic adaptor subunit [Gemmatimonadetes bacterium]|nr:efflux RND transporter periplasmic adaptor subunit [Gemmatimonadota bacterium]
MGRAGWLAGVAGVLALGACGMGESSGAAAAATTQEAAEFAGRVVNVSVLSVQPEPFADYVTVTGSVAADRDVMIASEESGVVREVFVSKGSRVGVDQAIAKLDDRVLKAQHEQVVAEAELARETYERQRRLWEDDSIGSEMAYLRAKYGAETAAASARALGARLERTTIRAPIAGVLDDRFVEVGSMVAPGSPVGRIVDADPLKVTAGVPERYAGEVRPGVSARIAFDNGKEIEGTIGFVSSTIDEANRTFQVEARVGNSAGALKPGMVARLRVARGRAGAALLVPRDAVLRVQAGYVVYVAVEREGRAVAESRVVPARAMAVGSQSRAASRLETG